MPRLLFAAIATASLALGYVTTAGALSTPNPAGRWQEERFFLAADLQINFDKDLKGGGEIEDMVGFFLRPSYSLARDVTIYGRIGFQDADRLDLGFAAGFGLQGAYALPRSPEWAIGGAFDFLYWNTETRRGRDFDWIELQFTPAVSYTIRGDPTFTPYVGLPINFLTGDADEDKILGLLFGTNIDFMPSIRLDFQLRLIHETGFLFSAGYLF